ncbi:MAG: class I SAM-dependent methyltransferase [Pseudomonadota bacterium]
MIESLKTVARRVAYSRAGAKWMQRLTEWRTAQNAEEPPAVDDDGVPIPSAFLITMVLGPIPWQDFLSGGRTAIDIFADAVNRNGGDFRGAETVLDLGCGCGRLARFAPKVTDAAYYGVDYNQRLVDWCAANLPGKYAKNDLHPPLDFPTDYFDVVFLLSVFTHLRIDTQNEWLSELARIVKPGGFCLITFHDEDHPNMALTDSSRDDLLVRKTLVYNDRAEGSNLISTFQTRAATEEQFADRFEVAEIIPSTATPIQQAIAVLRRSA